MRENRTLYCIVADPMHAAVAKPDTGYYTPKELAFKEGVSTTSVYSWIRGGLPVMRQGHLGNIRIYYQDYIQWMIDCAREDFPSVNIPSWAFRFVKAATPNKKRPAVTITQKATPGPISASVPTSTLSGAKKASERTENAKKDCRNGGNGQISFLDLLGKAV